MFDGLLGILKGRAMYGAVCSLEDYERWKAGETVYLAKEKCFATFSMKFISREDEKNVTFDNRLSLEEARYAYTRNEYEKVKSGAEPFDNLADEERREFYFDHVLGKYNPIMFYDWVNNANSADILEYDAVGIDKKYVVFTLNGIEKEEQE